MYTPPAFALRDDALTLQLCRDHAFGMLIATVEADGAPAVEIAHLPMLVEGTDRPVRVLGHVAKGNPIRHALLAGGRGTAVFSGPHAYISPDWYAAEDQVPTWNYLAVHLHGRFEPVTESGDLARLLAAITAPHENDLAPKRPWTQDKMSDGLMERMMKGIVGFRLLVERVEAKAKLSQNKKAPDLDGAIAGLTDRGGPGDLATAAWMARLSGC